MTEVFIPTFGCLTVMEKAYPGQTCEHTVQEIFDIPSNAVQRSIAFLSASLENFALRLQVMWTQDIHAHHGPWWDCCV